MTNVSIVNLTLSICFLFFFHYNENIKYFTIGFTIHNNFL